jgi:tRNA(Ile2) C34 agmatinyltransferase TiaS
MLDIILLGVAAVLVITLFEIIEDRKRKEFTIKRLYDENHSLETKAQELVNLKDMYEYEC